MASTFATLRALQLVIADALDDIQRVFSQHGPPSPSLCSTHVYPLSPDPSPDTSPFPASPSASFPPTPLSSTFPSSQRSPTHTDMSVCVDYPSPDLPTVPNSLAEQLALHPDATAAASRIVAACGQMSNIVHKPFSSLCDAIMSYNLPACMRLVEHLHVAEILREAGENKQRSLTAATVPPTSTNADSGIVESGPVPTPLASDVIETDGRTLTSETECMLGSRTEMGIEGLHVSDIANVICSYAGIHYVDPDDLVHALRLLSTHHIFRETAPDTFALTRVASLLDSGKSVRVAFSNPETKYADTGGIPAFVALITDELFKSAAYLTEAFTGVRLPTLPSTPIPTNGVDANLPRETTIASTFSLIINEPVPCAETTRSSSALTHIVYPDDESVRPPFRPLQLTESSKMNMLHSLTTDLPLSSQPLVGGSTVLTPCPSLTGNPTQVEKERLSSADAAKPERMPAFNLAFRTHAPFFEWLENGGEDPLGGTGQGACTNLTRTGNARCDVQPPVSQGALNGAQPKPFRFGRFSNAMTGTTLWEAPRAILNGFDWYSLPKGSTVVDVGGGIGSTTMILARALADPRVGSGKEQDDIHNEGLQPTPNMVPCRASKVLADSSFVVGDKTQTTTAAKNGMNLRFIVQDKAIVTVLGMEAWRSQCPELLESGQVIFQDHDFFEPQSPLEPPHLARHPAVYLLRVVLHDWPDECARRILINLRVASNPETRLVIAEHVLPLACLDEDVPENVNAGAREEYCTREWTLSSVLAHVEGAERTLVPPPLLSNLGKASANAYWMDLLMHIMFNGKERTLREFCALALSAGWRVTRMTRPEGTLFAYLVCEPITLPDDAQAIHNAVVLSSELSTVIAVPSDEHNHRPGLDPSRHKQLPARPVSLLPSPILQRSSSRCGTPTFGSRILLPKDEELQSPKAKGAGAAKKWLRSKGLGVRGVMMQKAEKQREDQNREKGAPTRDNDAQNGDGARASPSHMRVWWKKSPPGSTSIVTSNSSSSATEIHTTAQARHGTFASNDSPSTPSPRISPAHQKWSSTESAALPMAETSPRAARGRRPSVASITRKLSFATFGRRPSIADITESLPTPPHSASTLTELAPPPTLRGDIGRSLKHLPSLPALGSDGTAARAEMERPAIPRRPSFSLFGQISQPAPKSVPPRRPDAAGTSKSSIPKPHASLHAGKRGSPDLERSAESTLVLQRERRVTLSNAPGGSSKAPLQSPGGVSAPPDPASPIMKRIPSVPKLPRRLSIPMLRRKQG